MNYLKIMELNVKKTFELTSFELHASFPTQNKNINNLTSN